MKTDVRKPLLILIIFLTFLIPLSQADEQIIAKARAEIDQMVKNIKKQHDEATSNGNLDSDKYVIPPHLHDLQEADLPETQRGLVISEIALFRERSAKREREKMKELPPVNVTPAGPKQREWGKPQPPDSRSPTQQAAGKGAQGYDKPVGFVKEGEKAGRPQKTDKELEADRVSARRRDEENSFRDVGSVYLFHLHLTYLLTA